MVNTNIKNLIGLVYVSAAKEVFDVEHTRNLSIQSSITNKKLGITGYLYFDGEYFLQYLEGEKEKVNGLMDKIRKDSRHQIINVLINEALTKPNFPTWSMRFLDHDSLIKVKVEQLVIKYVCFLSMRNFPSEEDMYRSVWSMIDTLSMLRVDLEKGWT